MTKKAKDRPASVWDIIFKRNMADSAVAFSFVEKNTPADIMELCDNQHLRHCHPALLMVWQVLSIAPMLFSVPERWKVADICSFSLNTRAPSIL